MGPLWRRGELGADGKVGFIDNPQAGIPQSYPEQNRSGIAFADLIYNSKLDMRGVHRFGGSDAR